MITRVVRRWWPLAAVAVLLVAAGLSAAHATPQLDRIARDGPDGPHPTLEVPDERFSQPPEVKHPEANVHLPSWLPVLLYTVLLALVLAMVVLMVRSLVGRLRGKDSGEEAEDGRTAGGRRPSDAEVLAAVEAGLAELSDSDADPRRAVIACWLRLEQAAEAAGVARHPADTATDLVVRLLDGRVASADVLAGFAGIYREARYATRPIGEQAREQARSALHTLRAELTSEARR